MYTSLAFAAFLSASVLAQSTPSPLSSPASASPPFSSTSTSPVSLSSPSSSGIPLTTSIVFVPNQPGYLDASIVGVGPGGTTMALSCPNITTTLNPPHRLVNRAGASSSSSSPPNQCAMTALGNDIITLTESPAGSSSAISLDYATTSHSSSSNTASTAATVYFSTAITVLSHCQLQGTTTGSCTLTTNTGRFGVQPASIASIATTDALASTTTTGASTTQLGPSQISMVQIVVTAGQEKLPSPTTTATSSPSASGTAGAKPSSAAGEKKIDVGMTGAIMAGVMGFAMMA